MKKFVFLVLAFFACCGLSVLSMRLLWVTLTPRHMVSNFLPAGVSTVVMGPSNGECAWNDSLIPHSLNLCESASSFAACYSTLRWVTEYNEQHPDTVILCASIVAMTYENDQALLLWLEENRSLLCYDTFLDYFKRDWRYWKMALTQFPFTNFYVRRQGGAYLYLKRDKLSQPYIYSHLNRVIGQMGGDGEHVTEQAYRDYCPYQIDYLRRFSNYCREHHQVLVIMSTPVYKIPDLLNDRGYRRLLRAELGDSALVADYSRFEFPDTTYYGDLEHLNHRGATYFSRYIATHGLELQTMADYCKE